MFKKLPMMILLGLAVVYLALPATAAGQALDRKTVITINQPIEVPGKPAVVLPAGKYVLRLHDGAGTRTIVQVFNEDETRLYTMLMGVPDFRLDPPETTEIRFYEREAGRAHRIRSWFFPASNYGIEFTQPKDRPVELARTRTAASLD